MSGLALFDLDFDPQNLPQTVDNLQRYVQDNTHGYPIYSSAISVDSLYRDSEPQLIELIEPVDYGNLLNIFYRGEAIMARKATASDPERYCNSVALESGAERSIIKCAVRVGFVRKFFPFLSAPVFLSTSLGQFTNTISPSGKIVQKVGDTDTSGNFLFQFHTPFLI